MKQHLRKKTEKKKKSREKQYRWVDIINWKSAWVGVRREQRTAKCVSVSVRLLCGNDTRWWWLRTEGSIVFKTTKTKLFYGWITYILMMVCLSDVLMEVIKTTADHFHSSFMLLMASSSKNAAAWRLNKFYDMNREKDIRTGWLGGTRKGKQLNRFRNTGNPIK